jgi:hypothetical protein
MCNCKTNILNPTPTIIGNTKCSTCGGDSLICETSATTDCITLSEDVPCVGAVTGDTLTSVLNGICSTCCNPIEKIYTLRVHLTSEQILNLGTPLKIFDATGPNTVFQPISSLTYYKFGTTPYTNNVAYYIYQSNPSTFQLYSSGIIGSLTDAVNLDPPGTFLFINTPLYIWCPLGNPFGGDGELTITITYKIISL